VEQLLVGKGGWEWGRKFWGVGGGGSVTHTHKAHERNGKKEKRKRSQK